MPSVKHYSNGYNAKGKDTNTIHLYANGELKMECTLCEQSYKLLVPNLEKYIKKWTVYLRHIREISKI